MCKVARYSALMRVLHIRIVGSTDSEITMHLSVHIPPRDATMACIKKWAYLLGLLAMIKCSFCSY